MFLKNIAIKKSHNPKKIYTILLLVFLLCSSCKSSIDRDRVRTVRAEEIETQEPDRGHPFPGLQSQGLSMTAEGGQVLPITAQAIIKERVFNLEVAQTPQQQAMGLMFRETLPDDRGMLFPFDEARIARFWMNNVPVALDMIFFKAGKVVAIANSAPPCNTKPQDCPLYGPDTMVDGVIELRGGRAKELGLAAGDAIEIEFLKPQQQN